MATGGSWATGSVADAIDEIAAGRAVVIVDSDDPDSEGDLVIAAQSAGPDALNFMAMEARGLICLALTTSRCDELGLDPLGVESDGPDRPAFTVSIEARTGVSTGISMGDRARTISVAIDPEKTAQDLVSPGHVLPLRARPGGVFERAGKTEAAVDLARLADRTPAAVICGILRDDGRMARLAELTTFCERHDLAMVTIPDIIQYRLRSRDPRELQRLPALPVGTPVGELEAIFYRDRIDSATHVAFLIGEVPADDEPFPTYVHLGSPLFDLFAAPGARSIDDFWEALRKIKQREAGVAIYVSASDGARPPEPESPIAVPERLSRDSELTGAIILADLGVTEAESIFESEPERS
jgi:3,4-dihydroxy 2-butanone 4-phosphate synthase/GTP cyclohydrolase II